MAFTVSELTQGADTVDRTNYTTASISPAADSLLIFAVLVRDDDLNPPTLCTVTAPSGVTIRGTFENPRFGSDDHYRLYYVMGFTNSSPSSGTCNLAFGDTMGYCAWAVIQIQGVDLTHGSGSGTEGLVQDRSLDLNSVEDPSIQFLAATENSENLALAIFGLEDTASPWDPGSGWTQVHDQQDLFVEYKLTDGTQMTATSSTTTASHTGAIIIEIAGGGAPQTVFPDHISSTAAVHNPTLTTTRNVPLDFLGPTSQVFQPTLLTIAYMLPSFMPPQSVVFNPSIPLLLKPDFLAPVTVVYDPVVQSAVWSILPDFIPGGSVVHSPSLSVGAVAIVPAFLASTGVVYAVIIIGGEPARFTFPQDGASSMLILPPPVGRGIVS